MTVLEPATGEIQEHRTVSRVTNILELAARNSHGVRLVEIAAELDAPRSSLYGLVKGLVANGYLRDDGGTYTIGPAISALLVARPTLERAARVGMEKLHSEFDETVTLVSLIGDSIVYTDAIESTQAIRYNPTLRVRRPLYPTSAGKCYLANASERFRENYLAAHTSDYATREHIRQELRTVKEQGGAINQGETLPELYSVSVPIFDGAHVAAVLTIAGPSARFADRLDELLGATKNAAHLISSRLQ
ncbi:IclR family transcriptional regulator [Rhodococcus erythropolis]|uniref:IclR family transcriptional regulator n=1 Tax=Rhodococcus erythropolis TaxID=1833 RepID=UPI00378AB45A